MELHNEYLTLKLRRLKSPEPLDWKGRGLKFMIVKSGEGVWRGGASPQRLGAGTVLVADGAAGGKLEAREQGEMVLWVFEAELEHLFPLFSGREICLLQKVAESFQGGRVYPGTSALAKECLRLVEEVPAQFSLDHRSQVLRIVSAILTVEFKAAQPQLADFVPMRDHVLQVFERLGTQELLSLPVGELARKFHCSRRHLNRLFHQHFGVSVGALRMEMRLLKAVSLLVDPDAKVIHVAEKCGFNHLGLFNTCFKKRFGSSPGAWRKSAAQAGPPAATKVKGEARFSLGMVSPAEPTEAGRTGQRPGRLLEPVAAGNLLRDLAALKTGRNLPVLPQAQALAFASEGRHDRRNRVAA